MKEVSKKPLITIIIPVYKVEDYLDKCVESVVNQTYKNLEIILVDDGSPDNCPKMCDDWAKKDKRIKVIHKENGGLSDARNKGIDVAKGKYIGFVDSDDTLAKSFIEYLYGLNVNYNTKISVAPYIIVTDTRKIYCNAEKNNMKLNQKEALTRMLLDKGFTVSACSKLYEASLFKDVRFPKGKVFEDTATTYKLFFKCEYISYGWNGGYYYYKRDNSIINSNYNKGQLSFIEHTDQMGDAILNRYPDLSCVVESKKIDARFSILRRIVMIDEVDEDSQEAKEGIKKYILERKTKILFGKYNFKIKMATFLLCFGEDFFKCFWKIYTKLKYNA